MNENCPGRSSASWAVDVSNAVTVAPRSVSAVPTLKTPTSVNSRAGPLRRTFTRSPTRKPCFLAVAASIATSLPLVGRCPSFRVYGERPAMSVNVSPSVGGPRGVMALPLWSMRIAVPSTSPAAALTPSMWRTSERSEAGTG